MEDPGGAVVARLAIEGAEFWLSDKSPEHGNFSPESLGAALAANGKRLAASFPLDIIGNKLSEVARVPDTDKTRVNLLLSDEQV